jgi:hypothetical protein
MLIILQNSRAVETAGLGLKKLGLETVMLYSKTAWL